MTTTDPIVIHVETEFLPEHSEPSNNKFAFSYTITISNKGSLSAKLLTRHWIITDANGNKQEVHGEGVVGVQPLIMPGKSYRYSSGAILPTPVGSMQGAFTMINSSGDYFDATIAPFRLAMPQLVN